MAVTATSLAYLPWSNCGSPRRSPRRLRGSGPREPAGRWRAEIQSVSAVQIRHREPLVLIDKTKLPSAGDPTHVCVMLVQNVVAMPATVAAAAAGWFRFSCARAFPILASCGDRRVAGYASAESNREMARLNISVVVSGLPKSGSVELRFRSRAQPEQ